MEVFFFTLSLAQKGGGKQKKKCCSKGPACLEDSLQHLLKEDKFQWFAALLRMKEMMYLYKEAEDKT